MRMDDRAWDRASKEYKTLHPSPEQVQKSYLEMMEEVEDEAGYYHGEDE